MPVVCFRKGPYCRDSASISGPTCTDSTVASYLFEKVLQNIRGGILSPSGPHCISVAAPLVCRDVICHTYWARSECLHFCLCSSVTLWRQMFSGNIYSFVTVLWVITYLYLNAFTCTRKRTSVFKDPSSSDTCDQTIMVHFKAYTVSSTVLYHFCTLQG